MSRVRFIGPMLILIAATTMSASGAIIQSKTSQGGDGSVVITLQGQIELGDEKKFVNAMLPYTDGTVILSSLGGSLFAGIEIGKAIRLKGFTTIVPDGITCASACALAWLGGRVRGMGIVSKIGFHASYLRGSGQVTSSGNALVGAYLSQLGLSSSAIVYLTKAPPSELQWLSEADAGRLGITVSLIDSKKFSAALEPKVVPPPSPTTALPALSPRTEPTPTVIKTKEKDETANPKTVPASSSPNNGFPQPRSVKSVRVRPDGKPILDAEEPPVITGGLEPTPKVAGDSLPRAAMLVGARKNTKDYKTYPGNVVWRLENTSRGPGQPLSLSIRAEADITEARVKVTILIQKNADETLPASHLMTVLFAPAVDSGFPAVDEIDIPQMRNEGSPAVDALMGVPTKITANMFLVGLSRDATFQARNNDMLKSRGWLDIPMRFSDGRIAKVTFEKGPAGDRAFSDFFASLPSNGFLPPPRPAAAGAGDIATFRSRVAGKLASSKRYPDAAKSRGATGVAIVSFRIDGSGNATGISLAKSSGHADLDAETLAMVRRASPFPPPPPGAQTTFSAPVNYNLR